MLEATSGIIIFCSFSALAFSGAAIWFMEIKALSAPREITPISYTFLAGAVAFSFAYMLNRLLFPYWPKSTAAFNLLALAIVFVFPTLKKKFQRRKPRAGKKHRMRAEAEALRQMLAQDPLNAYCYERLSEIYSELGNTDKALAAAQEALRLDPTIKNQWRVDDLEKHVIDRTLQKQKWKWF